MENAVKAMYIATGVLMGIMVLSLAAFLYGSLQGYVNTTNEQIRFIKADGFNSEYFSYINSNDGHILTIQDVITAANSAYENNYKYNMDASQWTVGDNSLYVQVLLNGNRIDNTINENMVTLLENNKNAKFSCSADNVLIGKATGQVYSINFVTIN